MAEFYTSHWGNNYSPRVRLVVSASNLNGNTARVTWILDYVASGYAAYTNGIARNWSINIDGQVRSGTYNINGVSSTTRISSGTIDVARGTSTRNISCSASFNFDVSWNGSYSGTRSASGSIGIERKPSYTVSFNANGGSGAPGNQTKWHDTAIALSSTRPTRTGHIFQGWATSSGGGVAYQPGAQYNSNANITLYAVWRAETYTISYNANGGSGAPGNQTKTYGQTLTLSSTRPTRTNYNFLGWGTSSGASSATYQPGGSYTNNAGATLYAVWQLAYTPPRITNVKADRCNSSGTASESGTYVRVSFSWVTDYNVSAISIRHKVSTSSSWTTTTVSASGKNGSVDKTIGSNGISTEYIYNIQIEIRDSNGSSIVGRDVPAMSYVIDFKAGGKGIAIGKPATEDGVFDVNLNIKGRNGMPIGYFAYQYIRDINQALTSGIYLFDNSTINQPNGIKSWGYLEVVVASVSPTHNNSTNWTWQRFYSTGGHAYERLKVNNNGWTPWKGFDNYFDSRMNATFDGKFDNRMKATAHKKLWTGILKKGQTVNVPNFSKYNLVACQPGSDGILLVGYKTSALNGGSSGQVHLSAGTGFGAWYNISFSYNGDSVTYTDGGNILTNIIGII